MTMCQVMQCRNDKASGRGPPTANIAAQQVEARLITSSEFWVDGFLPGLSRLQAQSVNAALPAAFQILNLRRTNQKDYDRQYSVDAYPRKRRARMLTDDCICQRQTPGSIQSVKRSFPNSQIPSLCHAELTLLERETCRNAIVS